MNQTKQSRQIVKLLQLINEHNNPETPKTVQGLFDMNAGMKSDIDFLFGRADRFDLLDYVGGLDKIEEYLIERKRQLIDAIVLFLENVELFEYSETGEPINLDNVLEYDLEFNRGGIKEFKSLLKKSNCLTLIDYRNILFSNQFTTKNK